MIPAFAEAIRATTQPCTLLLLLPALLMAVIAGGRWAASFAICLGAVLGGWLFIANVVSLSERQLQLSGILVAVAIGATTAAPFVPWLTWLERPSAQAAGRRRAFTDAVVATMLGAELGSILTASRTGVAAQLPGITAYMLGAMLPVLAVVLVMRDRPVTEDGTTGRTHRRRCCSRRGRCPGDRTPQRTGRPPHPLDQQ